MIADDLTAQIAALPDAVNVKNSLSEQVPQVKVAVNREAAAQYGLTAADGGAVRSELTGSTATTVTIRSQELDVVVRGSGAAAQSLDALKSMAVSSSFGGTVPLSSVAQVSVDLPPQTITRADQTRRVTITGDTTTITRAVWGLLDSYAFPQGHSAKTAGSYEDINGELWRPALCSGGGAAAGVLRAGCAV